jgi:hypothetical protein
MKMSRRLTVIAAMALLIPGIVAAAEPPATTRYLVTINKLKPGSAATWQKLYLESVVPALKKSGITFFSVSENVIGERPVFVNIRSLDKFGDLDGQGPLLRGGLSQKQADAINAARNAVLVSEDRYVANTQNEFIVPTAPEATIRVVQFFRPNPGQAEAFRALLRSSVLPAWQQAKKSGRISGAGVATTGQGKPGLTVIWVDYMNMAGLDGGNMLEQSMGAAGYALYQARLAQLGRIEESSVSRRIPELSFTTN